MLLKTIPSEDSSEAHYRYTHRFRVTFVPLLTPVLPRPPPRPLLVTQDARAIPESAAKPKNYIIVPMFSFLQVSLWSQTEPTCNTNNIKKIGSLTFFFGWNLSPS